MANRGLGRHVDRAVAGDPASTRTTTKRNAPVDLALRRALAAARTALDDAESAMASAELVLVIGTSGLVQPAASLPLTALGLGVPVVEINPEPTGFSAQADHSVQLASGTALPLMLSAARRSPGRA